jgi:hypothetical protein
MQGRTVHHVREDAGYHDWRAIGVSFTSGKSGRDSITAHERDQSLECGADGIEAVSTALDTVRRISSYYWSRNFRCQILVLDSLRSSLTWFLVHAVVSNSFAWRSTAFILSAVVCSSLDAVVGDL